MKDIGLFLKSLHPTGTFEIRVLGIPGRDGAKWTKFGYYQNVDKAVRDIAEIDKLKPQGIYVTVNPVNPDLLGRANEKLASGKNSTLDSEIERRRWLFLDIDAGQPSGVCANNAERKAAFDLMRHIVDTMQGYGWYETVQGASGNGAYLLYRIDLPNDDASSALLSKVLHRIADLTKGDFGKAHVDTTVYNASRVMRVLGTVNRKGDPVGERVHRQSEFEISEFGGLVSLEKLTDLLPKVAAKDVSEFTIIDDEEAAKNAEAACLAVEQEWGNDGSGYVLKLCGKCKAAGVHRERAVKIVKSVLSQIDDFPREYTDDEIGKRWDDSKTEVGKDHKPPAVLANFEMEEKRSIPRDLREIMNDFNRIGLDLVNCMGELFWIDEGRFYEVKKTEQLFSIIQESTRVSWGLGVSKAEFYEAVKRKATKVDSLEMTPHFPPIPGIRYLREITKGPTDELEKLLSLLNPDTKQDRELLLAAICTLSWGGLPGKRPGFAILSAEDMTTNQIGSGKSSTCDLCIMPHWLGQVRQHEIKQSRDFDQLRKHLVSPTSAGIRAIVLDNVKDAVSGQDIESLMTTTVVSGHKMYAGFGDVKNYFTWFANGNGLRLSDDVAKRMMPIRIRRANYGPEWPEKVAAINWEKVLAGVATVLDRPRKRMPKYSRWAMWEADVLSKCTDDPMVMQAELAERQKTLSETEQMTEELTEAIAAWVADNAEFCEKHKDGSVLKGEDIAFMLRGITGKQWSARGVSKLLQELDFLKNRIKRHPDTSVKRYIFLSACQADNPLEPEFAKIE